MGIDEIAQGRNKELEEESVAMKKKKEGLKEEEVVREKKAKPMKEC